MKTWKMGLSAVASRTGVTDEEAKLVIECFLDYIAEELKKERMVCIPGFGTFQVYRRTERVNPNPYSDEPLISQNELRASFKPAKKL